MLAGPFHTFSGVKSDRRGEVCHLCKMPSGTARLPPNASSLVICRPAHRLPAGKALHVVVVVVVAVVVVVVVFVCG